MLIIRRKREMKFFQGKGEEKTSKNVCCQQYYGHSEIYKVFIFVKLIMFDVIFYGIIA